MVASEGRVSKDIREFGAGLVEQLSVGPSTVLNCDDVIICGCESRTESWNRPCLK